MVYCSGLENPSEETAKRYGMAENGCYFDPHDALFAMRSEREIGAKVGTQNCPDWQRHYDNIEFIRAARGDLFKDHSLPELAALFAEVSREIGLPNDLPVPPHSLPGCNKKPDSIVMEVIRLGVQYAIALADGERRSLWNIHNQIDAILRNEWIAGRKAERDAVAAHKCAEITEAYSRQDFKARSAFVYFVQSGGREIKIGLAADVPARIRSLQTAHPTKLNLLTVTTGGQEAERAYHKQFAAHRLHGGWFDPHPDILAEIERLNKEARDDRD